MQTREIHDKQYRACCRQGVWIQVMTLHVPSTWPRDASHCIIWPWVDMFVLTSPEDHQPSRPAPPATDILRFNSRLNKSEWLAALVNVITYPSEIMSHAPTPRAAVSLERERGSSGGETLSDLKGQGGRLPCRPSDEPLRILSLGKSKETVMLM